MKRALAAALFFACAGCSHLSDPHYDYDILYQDANACAANPKSWPGCVAGFVAYVRWRWQ
jgi:hypothetical protein